MSNNAVLPPETSGTEAHTTPPIETAPIAVKERSVFASLEQMEVKRDPKAALISGVINISIVLILLWIATHQIVKAVEKKQNELITLDAPPIPPKLPPKLQTMGGGGGQPDKAPVSKGSPPKFAPEQLSPPKVKVDHAKLAVEATVDVDPNVKMAKTDLPNFGMPNSPNIGSSMGNGHGTGLGSGNGAGLGAGSGGGTGGGLRRIGGGVSAPVVLFQPEPEFSEEARKAKVAGSVIVYLEVDQTGAPRNVRIVRGIGMGLDEKAMEAVRHYKFKPAMENGKPVAVPMNVEVNFQIF